MKLKKILKSYLDTYYMSDETTVENKVMTPPEPSRGDKNAVFAQGGDSYGMAAPASGLIDDVPFESVPLPSKGLLYPEGSPLYGRETVDIRVMTAREEDILTSRALIKKGTVITELLKSCLMDKSINVQDMVAGDRNALMVALRITGYGAEYPAEIECNACGHVYDNSFNLAELPIKRLEISPVKPGENVFEYVLPVSKRKVHFKFLTGADEEQINIIQDKLKKLGNQRDEYVTTRLKHSIVEIDGVTSKAEISRFVDHMRAGDSKSLRRYMDKHEPGMVMKQDASCPACGHEEEVGMPLGASFFWPE